MVVKQAHILRFAKQWKSLFAIIFDANSNLIEFNVVKNHVFAL